MNWQSDSEYREYIVEEVEVGDRSYAFRFDGSMWTGVDPNLQPLPKVGERIRLYPGVWGTPNRGLIVFRDGRWQVTFYRTPEQQRIYDAIWVAERRVEGLRTLLDDVENRNKRIAALPAPLRERLERFIEIGGIEYRANSEAYELFVCEEAFKLIVAFTSPEDVQQFYKAPLEQQRETLPNLSDGHSGNTFGAACKLAYLYLDGKHDAIAKVDHGALAPLTGSYKPEVDRIRDVVRAAMRTLDERHPAYQLLKQAGL